jgi:hypothetical protein
VRFEYSPGLFGSDKASCTGGKIRCDFCGKTYNNPPSWKRCFAVHNVHYIIFCGKIVCECCFEHIEEEIIERMDIIPAWFARREEWMKHKRHLVELVKKLTYEKIHGYSLSDRKLRLQNHQKYD